jgi:hypothetical protein
VRQTADGDTKKGTGRPRRKWIRLTPEDITR